MCERERDFNLSSSPYLTLDSNLFVNATSQKFWPKLTSEIFCENIFCLSLSVSVSEQFLTKYFQSGHTDWI